MGSARDPGDAGSKDGFVGWGEAFGHAAIPAIRAALDTAVAPLVIGCDANDIEALSRMTQASRSSLRRH
jgi:L-alanine-DL-glutamate epimerase-like enolase superfamily enzyme